MGGTNCRFHSSVITDSFNYADNQESVKLHWMQWSGKCRQDGFYFKNSFRLTHFVHLEKTLWKLELQQMCSHMAVVTRSILTVQLLWFWPACCRFQVWQECLPAQMNRQVASGILSEWMQVLMQRLPCSLSLMGICFLVCLWFGSMSFFFFFFFHWRRTSFNLYFSESDSEISTTFSCKSFQDEEVILVARPLAARYSHLPQSHMPSS